MSSSESDMEMLRTLSDWSDSESDKYRPQKRYKERINYTKTLEDHEFLLRFRLNKTLVENLLTEIYPYLKVFRTRNHTITPLNRLLLALRYYALGSLTLTGDYIGASKSAVIRIVREVSCAITHLYSKYIHATNTTKEFYKMGHFPQVLGVIDCTHIKIDILGRQIPDEYKNQNGYFSLNVQAICDANMMFMNLEANWPGSTHDATIFNNSVFRAQCERKTFGNKWLLGDNAYPLKSYLLTPLLNPASRGERLYNQSHNRTRNCIEQCFYVWKKRFPVLALTMHTSLLSANAVIISTAILHNICIMNGIEEVPPEINIPYEERIPVSNAVEVPYIEELEMLIAEHFDTLELYHTEE